MYDVMCMWCVMSNVWCVHMCACVRHQSMVHACAGPLLDCYGQPEQKSIANIGNQIEKKLIGNIVFDKELCKPGSGLMARL